MRSRLCALLLLAGLLAPGPLRAQSQLVPVTNTPQSNRAQDFSVNAPSLGGLNLLATIPVSNRLGGCFIQNGSLNVIHVVLDDGAGNNQTIFVLDPAAASDRQGGAIDCSSAGFTGRIRVYGTAGSQVAIRAW